MATKVKGERDEENFALLGHARMGKGAAKVKKGEGGSSQDGKKDISKVKCFACHKIGHYVSQCINKKEDKGKAQVATSTKIIDFVVKFEQFSLVATCLFGTSVRSA